jgi:hypothetical protein
MNLYLIEGKTSGYDVYTSAVIAAASAEDAKLMHPDGQSVWIDDAKEWRISTRSKTNTWCHPKDVEAYHIGVSHIDTTSVILASFNAG